MQARHQICFCCVYLKCVGVASTVTDVWHRRLQYRRPQGTPHSVWGGGRISQGKLVISISINFVAELYHSESIDSATFQAKRSALKGN